MAANYDSIIAKVRARSQKRKEEAEAQAKINLTGRSARATKTPQAPKRTVMLPETKPLDVSEIDTSNRFGALLAERTAKQQKQEQGYVLPTDREPTSREMLARIVSIGKTDPEKGNHAFELFTQLQDDSASPYYNPYAKATNQNALSYLSEYLGEDLTGGVSEDWLSSNRDLLSGARYTTTGEAPAAPTKSSTPEQNAAYWYYQLLRDEETTQSAEADWQRMKDDIAYYVSRGLSDDEVLAKVQGGTYGALQSMEKGKKNGVPVGMNRAVDYSEDTIYGAIWAARNGGGTGNGMFDAVNYTMGTGNKYKPDPAAEARRNPGSPDYQPYDGPTIEDAMRYFGVTSFDADWQDENRWRLSDGSKETQRMFERVGTGIKNANEAQAELSAMWEEVETALTFTTDADEILNDLRYADGDAESGKRNSTYSTLWKMDEARLNGDPLALAFGVNYRWEDFEAAVRQRAKTQIEAREAVERDAKTKEERKQRAVGFSRAATGLTEAGEAVAVQPEQPGFWQRVMNLFTPSTKAAPKAEEAPAAEPTPGPTAGPTAAPTAAPTAVPSPSPTGAVDDPRDAAYAQNQEEQARQSEASHTVSEVITARANEHTAEELAQAQTFLSAANGHTFEAAEATRGFWGTVKDIVVGTENTPVFTDADESQLDFLRVQLRVHPQSELADYWKQKVEMLEEKRDKYTQAYGQSPTYQQRINSLHEAGDDEGVTNLLASGLHIHTAFTYGDINKYLVPALSTMTDEAMTAEGYSEFEQGRIAEMRGAISKLFARPVPEANVDGWLQGVARFFVDTLQGQGAYERAALNEGIDIQTLGTLATGDMFSLSGKALLGFTKLAAAPVKGAMGLAGQQEAYQAAEDRLINDEIRLENARLDASGEALAKHGTGGDMLLYQMSRDTGKALLELGYIGGTATGIAAAGGSTALARNTARLMYGLQSAGSTAAELSLTEGADTLQWVGASLASGLITMGVMALGVEDKVLGRWIEGASAQTGKAILDTGARKGVALYGRKFLNFIKELATGFAGEYAEEGLEEGLSAPLTDLIMEGKTKPAREYLSDANRAGISGGLIGLVLAGATYSAAAPEMSRSHQMMVEIMEDIDAGMPVAQESLAAMIEQSQADLKNPEIIGPVIRQAGDLQVSEVLVDSIAKGGMDAVYDGPEASAVQTATLALENATAELRDNMEARNAAGEAENAARSAFLQNPADTGLLEAFNDARDMNVKATETFIQSSKAHRDAEQRVRQAQADLEAVEQSTYEALRMEAEQAVVQLGQDAETKGKDPAARAMLGAEAPLRAHAQGDAATNPSDDSIAERAEKSTGDSGATDGMRFMSVPAEAAGAAARTEESKGAVSNPISIMRTLTTDLEIGAAIGTSRMNPEGRKIPQSVLGYYKEGSGYLATREASDFNTALHEIGHAIMERTGFEPTDAMLRALNPVFAEAYDADALPGEAFAEFVRQYVVWPENAEETYGRETVATFERALKGEGLLKQVQAARDDLQAYRNASFGERTKSLVVDRSEAKASTLKSLFDRLAAGLVDWTRPAEAVNARIREATGENAIPVELNLREAALWRNVDDTRAAGQLTNALTDSHGRIIGPSLADALAETGIDGRGESFADFSTYLLIRHSFDRDAQGKPVFNEKEFTAERRQKYMAELEAQYPAFQAAGEALDGWWNDFMQAWLVDTGLMTQKTWDTLRETYPHYVPTYRHRPSDVTGKRSGGAGRGKFNLRKATGSDLEIYNPIDSMVDMVGQVVRTASKNNMAVVFDAAYNEYDGLGVFARPLDANQTPETARTVAAMEKDALTAGAESSDADGIGTFLNSLDRNPMEMSEKDAIRAVRPDGSVVFYEVFDAPLYNLLAAGGEAASKTGWEWVGRITRGMAMLTTGSNPVFGITNAIRDFQSSVNHGSWASNYLTGLPRWAKAFYEVWRNKGEYADYVAMGGGGWNRVGTESRKSARAYRGDLFKGYAKSSVAEKARAVGEKAWSAITLSRLNEIVENTSRYAEYRFGKHDRGTDAGRLKAFRAAQEATVDFGRKGDSEANYAKALRQAIPFFNAALQGTYQAGRDFTAAERGRLPARFAKTVINTTLATSLAHMLLMAFSDDEEKRDFSLLSADVQNGYMILPNPFETERRFIRIPVNQNPLARAVHGFVTQAFLSDTSDDLVDGAKLVAASVLDGMNPAGSTIISPIISLLSNKNWYGGPIVSERLRNYPVTRQYSETTPELFVVASRALDSIGVSIAPLQLQYVAEQYGGWIGDLAIPALSPDRYTGELGGLAAVLKTFANRLTIDPAYSNDVTDAFYSDRTKLEQLVKEFGTSDTRYGGAYSDLLAAGLTAEEEKAAFAEAKALLSGPFGTAADNVSEMYDQIGEVYANDTLQRGQQNILARDIRQDMVYEMLTAEEAYADFQEKYLGAKSMLPYVLFGGPRVTKPTALDAMPDVFRADLDSGAQYMQRAQSTWEATGKDAALPRPNDGFTVTDSKTKVQTEYVIPDDYRAEWDAEYRTAYEKAMRISDAQWSAMTDDQKLEKLRSAHSKGHEAAKGWWMKWHKGDGVVK